MKNIFEYSFPSVRYLAIRWPKSKPLVKKYVMSNHKKPDLLKLSLCCLKDLNYNCKHPIRKSLKLLSKKCSENHTYNSYHDQHHFKSVIVVSSIFANILSLKNNEKIFLILLALTHDMNHQGRRILSTPYYQELKTLKKVQPYVFKHFVSYKMWIRFKRILLNTYFPKIVNSTDDIVEKILLDVDIICSMMFGHISGLILSKRLKHEIRFEKNSEELYKGFLSLLEKKKLHLDISKKSCAR